jgi:hypothetical protein
MNGITYDADLVAMVQQRTDERYTTKRAIRRTELEVTRQAAPPKQIKQTHTVHALIASEPLQWASQPTAVVPPATGAAAPAPAPAAATAAATVAVIPTASNTAVTSAWYRASRGSSSRIALTSSTGGSSSTGTSTATATAVHKYELHNGPVLNSSATLDTLMFSFAAGLFRQNMQPAVAAGLGYFVVTNNQLIVKKVDVYSSTVTRAKYDAKRQQFAAQGISTAETWVFHGTTSTENVHSIMTEGFKVSYIIVHLI